MTIRSSNYIFDKSTKVIQLTTGGLILNRLWFCYVDSETLEISDLRELEIISPLPLKRGIEDARLYWRDDHWECTGVVLETHTPYARLWRFRLNLETNTAEFIEALPGPDPKRIEKNWIPVAEQSVPEFDYIYSTAHTYKNGTLEPTLNAPVGYEWVRGGSQLITWDSEHYISVTHRVYQDSKWVYNTATFGMETRYLRDYVHQFALWDKQGRLVGISDDYIFHEGGIEYAAGLVQIGQDLVISFGRWDVATWFCRVPVSGVTFTRI